MNKFEKLNDLKDAIKDARHEALKETYDYKVAKSRGLYITFPESGDFQEWNGTLKELKSTIAFINKEHPAINEISISGGYDGADNVNDMNDGVYDPWIASFDVIVWTK